MTTRTVTMSHSELPRFGVITRDRERRLTQVEAARMLNLGVRQVQRPCAAVAQLGAGGLVSRKRGRPSTRRFPDQLRRTIVTLISAHYSDFGPTLASEKLLERHQIAISNETVRKLMIGAGIWQTRAQRRPMHYDAACPQGNGSIAVASRRTSKTTRLRAFTSSRQVTNVYLWLSNPSKYWRARPIHAM